MSRPLRVDFHTHILPKNWPDLKQKYGYGGFVRLEHHRHGAAKMIIDDKVFREVGENTWSTDCRLKECDEKGVDVQVLSTVPVMFSYWAKPEHTLDLSRYLNDHISHEVSINPRRFVGLGTLPMQAPDLAAKELRRCIQDLGLAGVQIGSHVNSWNLDAKELYPVWEEAQNLGASIFIHPWDMMGKEQTPKYWLPWLVGMPAETSRAICSLMMGGVLERFPKLKVAFAHGGGSFPMTIGRIAHGFDVRPDLCATETSTNPRDLLSRIWVDSLVHDAKSLEYIVDLFGADHVMLGSDYPFPLGEEFPGKLIDESTRLDESTKERILGKNALDFLGVTMDRFR